jgi:hypothetical protein
MLIGHGDEGGDYSAIDARHSKQPVSMNENIGMTQERYTYKLEGILRHVEILRVCWRYGSISIRGII